MEPHRTGVEGVILKDQAGTLLRRQAVFDERQIQILVAAVELVADDGMAEVREVDADLVFAPGAGFYPEQGKRGWRVEGGGWSAGLRRSDKSPLNPEFRLRGHAVRADAIFDNNATVFIFAERRVNQPVLLAHMAVHDSEIFFFNRAAFENFSEFAGNEWILRHDDHAAGFAVEAVDKVGLGNS